MPNGTRVDTGEPHHWVLEKISRKGRTPAVAMILPGQYPTRYDAHKAIYDLSKSSSSYDFVIQARPGPCSIPQMPRKFKVGDRVVTIQVADPDSNWTSEAVLERKFGLMGHVVRLENEHYVVEYDIAGSGWFESRELAPIIG